MSSRVKDGVDALAEFHHALGVFDFASHHLQFRMLELERRIANDGSYRIALVEKRAY